MEQWTRRRRIAMEHSSLRLALALLSAGAGQLLAPSAQAQSSHPRFGVVGLAGGQVARLNVVNTAVPRPSEQLTCEVALSFVDGSGVGIEDPEEFVLVPGRSASIELTYAEALLHARERVPSLRFPLRLPIRGVVAAST